MKDKYLKNGVSEAIVPLIKHVNFWPYKVCPAEFIWKNRQCAINTQSSLTFYASNDLYLQSKVLRRKILVM